MELKYTANQVIEITGCTPAQFKDWTRTTAHREPLVNPAFKSIGPPVPNFFSISDLVKFAVIKKLTLLGTERSRIHNILVSHERNASLGYPFNVLLGDYPASLKDMHYIENNLDKDQKVYLSIECFETMVLATMQITSGVKFISYYRLHKGNWIEASKSELSKAETLEIKEGANAFITFELMSIVKKLWATAKKL